MHTSASRRSHRRSASTIWSGGLIAAALLVASCSDDSGATTSTDGAGQSTDAPTSVDATDTTQATDDTAGSDTTEATTTPGSSFDFAGLPAPTGEEMKVGLVNTEGTPGLDYPEIRVDIEAAVDYLNEHGGFGGRPIALETCVAKGSPESSQACAQELAGKGVELVLIGLDLFPDYATYTAAGIPVIGALPIFPADYTANALFMTGGNATVAAAMAGVAKEHFDASSVAIISSDSPGSNQTEAALSASLDLLGIAHTTVKGGDNETDAGFQGLMREAAKDSPDVLVSLYSDDGCIGTMRGRAAMAIDIPVITTAVCAGRSVLDEVGDDALGWTFVGVSTKADTPEQRLLQEIVAPTLGVEPAEVDSAELGLGALGLIEIMSLAKFSHMMVADGLEVTGPGMFDYLGTTPGLTQWPNNSPIECGVAATYPTVCSFVFPVGEYVEGGEVRALEGLETLSAKPYLP
ncbi:MAG: ABC transporter substrate-binding protein [Ilumatobacteraceae bacterium]